MIDKIDELLNRWEEGYERGQPPSPEQLCQDHPELLEELTWHIHALQAVDARFGSSALSREGGVSGDSSSTRLNSTVQVSTEFHIDRLHAAGGLGEVYLASDPLLHRTVAIKFPRANRLNSEQLARFAREAQVTGKLNHPGIVPVHALKQDNAGQPCYVMRFVDGPTLQDRIEQLFTQPQSARSDFYWSLEVRQLLQNFVSLCNITAYAHDHGIVHRDIKPANIILGPFGEIMLMDWGLAKILGEPEPATGDVPVSDSADTVVEREVKTRAGQFIGTPAYASPEQQQGRIDMLDARTDVYSLGATLLTMLTGSLPSRDGSQFAAVRNRSGGIVPSRLIAICQKALDGDLNQRYASVVDMREDIERYLAGEPISVVAETLWSRLSRTVRRRSGWAAALLVGVSVAIIGGSVGAVLLGQKNQQLLTTNQQLKTANANSLASQKRSTATTELLKRGLHAATPDWSQGKEATVRQFLDAISRELRSQPSIHPLVTADTHQVLADAYLALGAYDECQEHADLASQLHRQHSGESSADALFAEATRAQILSRRDQDEEAVRIARDALQRGRKVEGLDAETLITLIKVYGDACSAAPSPNYDEIVALHREAYELAKETFGATHVDTVTIGSDLAASLMDAGNLEDAEPLMTETRTAHESQLGPAHPVTLVDVLNLILLLHRKQETQAAADLARSHRKLFEDVLGVDHSRTIGLVLLTAQLEFGLENLPAAERESRQAYERAARTLGPVHQQTLEARGLLTNALVALGRVEEAESAALEQYNQAQRAFGDTHEATALAVTLLFDVAEAKGDVAAMEKWFAAMHGWPWESAAREALRAAKEKKANEAEGP